MTFYLGVPQILMLVMIAYSFTSDVLKHEKPYTKTENAWTSFTALLILLGILYWGGFFHQPLER